MNTNLCCKYIKKRIRIFCCDKQAAVWLGSETKKYFVNFTLFQTDSDRLISKSQFVILCLLLSSLFVACTFENNQLCLLFVKVPIYGLVESVVVWYTKSPFTQRLLMFLKIRTFLSKWLRKTNFEQPSATTSPRLSYSFFRVSIALT